MADPLSMVGGVVSIVTFAAMVTNQLGKLIHSLHHAPEDILALSHEVNNFNIILAEVELAYRSTKSVSGSDYQKTCFDDALAQQLLFAKSKLGLLDGLVRTLLTSAPSGEAKLHKYIWLRKKGLAQRLRNDLVEVRQNLCLLFATSTASRSVRIELSLRTPENACSQGQNAITSATSRHAPHHNGITSQLETSSVTDDRIQEVMDQMLARVSKNRQSQRRSLGATGNIFPIPLRTDNAKANLLHQPGTMEQDAPALVQRSFDTSASQKFSQSLAFSAISLSLYRSDQCDNFCDCSCHYNIRFNFPRALNQLIGSISVGCAGLPLSYSECTKSGCRNQFSRSFKISYTFPWWFLATTLHFIGATTFTGEPEFGLKVRHRIEYSSENSIFQLARSGNVTGIKSALRRREASPNDVSIRGGHTALYWAIANGGIDICQFLLSAGVDLYHEDDSGLTVAHQISSKILTMTGISKKIHDLASVFVGIDHSGLWGFSYLHKVVLEILPLNLNEELQNPLYKTEFDSLDFQDRSPLHWAALKGDIFAVQCLLLAGANVKRQDREGRSILQASLQSGNLRCTELLLMAGADIHAKDFRGDDALFCATWVRDDVDPFDLLLLAGAPVNSRNRDQVTALQSAACLNHFKVSAYLLDRKAHVNSYDNNGDTAIFETIYYGCFETLKVLLCQNIDFRHANNLGWTILHVVALYADLRTINLLLSVCLKGADPSAKDSKGRTALDAFERRSETSGELRRAFTNLLEGTKNNHC